MRSAAETGAVSLHHVAQALPGPPMWGCWLVRMPTHTPGHACTQAANEKTLKTPAELARAAMKLVAPCAAFEHFGGVVA